MAGGTRADYSLSKSALTMLVKLFAVRLADAGIRCYELRPGIMRTDMTKSVREQYDRRIADGLVPIRRWGEPEDVGRAVAMLAVGRTRVLDRRGGARGRRVAHPDALGILVDAPRPELLSLNTATVREKWNLAQMIEGCARHGIRGISPWRDKLDELGVNQAARMIRAHDLTVTGLCRGGMFTAVDRAGRDAAIQDNLKAIDDAATIGAQCLVLVAGGLPAGSKDLAGAREQVRDGIAAILPAAQAAMVPLAIEPLHPMYAADRACVNTLRQALDLCDGARGRRRASRWTCTTCGGIRSFASRFFAPGKSGGCSRITSATGWCLRRICCSIAG